MAQDNWSSVNTTGIFVTGEYDDYSEIIRRISDNKWEIARFVYETATTQIIGQPLTTKDVSEMMEEQGFDQQEIDEVIEQ